MLNDSTNEKVLRDAVNHFMWGKSVLDFTSLPSREVNMISIIDDMHPLYSELVELLLMISKAVGRDEVNEARYRIDALLEHYAELFLTTRRPDILEFFKDKTL
jgi:hypothetical protein